LINEENFPNFAEILINSVIECCILLSEWNHDFYSNNTIVKCLWKSILKLVNCSTDEVQKKCCMQINTLLQKLLEVTKKWFIFKHLSKCHLK
jgi:hemerythrin